LRIRRGSFASDHAIYFRRFAEKADMFELVMHPTLQDPPRARSSSESACFTAGSVEHRPGPHFAAPGCRVFALTVDWAPLGGGEMPGCKGWLGECRHGSVLPEHAVIGGSTQPVADAAARSCGRACLKFLALHISPLPSSPSKGRWLVQLVKCIHCMARVGPPPSNSLNRMMRGSKRSHRHRLRHRRIHTQCR
jgi:hypothetical protein